MLKKNYWYLFINALLSSSIILAKNQAHSAFQDFCNNVGLAAWSSFFFITRIIGAIFVGNITYIIQALMIFACIIGIEAFILCYFTNVSFLRSAFRMFLINIILSMISFLIIILNLFKAFLTYKYLGLLALLIIRILVSYIIYSRIDRQTSPFVVKKAILIANILSLLVSIIILMNINF